MIKLLNKVESKIRNKRMVIGFDGFIDHIVRSVPRTMSDLAAFLMNQQNMSCSIELKEVDVKIGGNNPIMSNALGKIGVSVDTIGSYGAKGIDPIFNELSDNCNIYSIADAGRCFAIEFDTNKLMMYTNKAAEVISFEHLISKVPSEILLKLFNNADGIAQLNFSEYQNVVNIWEGILANILPNVKDEKIFYFDLSDCSKVEKKYLLHALKVIRGFKKYGTVYLDLNDNELLHVFNAVADDENLSLELEGLLKAKYIEEKKLSILLKILFDKLEINTVIIRTLHKVFAYEDNNYTSVDNIFVEKPKLLTGAGDNQNAGICLGLICGLSIKEALMLGVMAGNFYIENGFSPNFDELRSFFQNKEDFFKIN